MMTRERVIQLDVHMPPEQPAKSAAAVSTYHATAKLLRRLYCMQYRQTKPSSSDYGEHPIARWDGGIDSAGKVFKPVWPKLAELVVDGQLDPYAFIRRGFAVYRTKATPPTPSQLQSEAVLSEYRRYKATIVADLRDYWDRECLELDMRRRVLLATISNVSEHAATITALLDTPTPTGDAAMFRYVAAAIMGCDRVCEFCHTQALLAYSNQKIDYDAAWGEKIPATLRTEADEYRRSLSS
jgi:hypothetical protein